MNVDPREEKEKHTVKRRKKTRDPREDGRRDTKERREEGWRCAGRNGRKSEEKQQRLREEEEGEKKNEVR